MSVIVKVSKETFVKDLSATLYPDKLYILPKDVYEVYIKNGVVLDYVDSLRLNQYIDFNSQDKKILILTMQALGDGLMLTPLLRYLKEKGFYIILEAKKDFNLLKDCPYVDEFAYSPLELDYIKSFENVLNLYMLVGSEMFDLNLVAHYYFKLLGIEADNIDLTPYVYIDKEKDIEIKNLFDEYKRVYKKPILGFHFAASSPHRMPPVNIFCEALKPLEKRFTIVYSYPFSYSTYAEEIKKYLPKSIDISSHIKDIEYLPVYVKNLNFLISVETVIPHIAAYTKTPTLAVLGPGRFDNIYNYNLSFIKGLEMNYKGQICSSPCQLHIAHRCPEAIVKNTNLSPCFSNLTAHSLVNAFLELLEDIDYKDKTLIKSLKQELKDEGQSSKILFERLSSIPISVFSEMKLGFTTNFSSLRQMLSFVFSDENHTNKKITLIARGYEGIGACLFIHKISKKKPYIYVENEYMKNILSFLGIESRILDYDNIIIEKEGVFIDISLSSFEDTDYKTYLNKILQYMKNDTIFFSFVLNKDRLKKSIDKGQDLYQMPFDKYINEASKDELKDFNLFIKDISLNPADFINTFGDYNLFKEIKPQNQVFRLLMDKYPYILAITNVDKDYRFEEITRFYSFYEKNHFIPDVSIKTSSEDTQNIFFSFKNPLNDYIKNTFENTLLIELNIFDKAIVQKYIEEYPSLENIWFYGSMYFEYFKQDKNFLDSLLFGPSINMLLDKNPFTDEDYLNKFIRFLTDHPNVNFYTTQRGVHDILGKKHSNLYYFDIEYADVDKLKTHQKTVDILVLSSSNFYPVENIDDVESFFSRCIQNFYKPIHRLVLDFLKELKDKKDLYYTDIEFLSFYKDIVNYSASLNYFMAQEIKNAFPNQKIVHAGILNFPEIRYIKDLAKEHIAKSRYFPDILITKEDAFEFLASRAKAIVYLEPLDSFQNMPLICLKASKTGIPCITKYQKSLEQIPHMFLVKNLEGYIEGVSLVL